ncbi:MAG: hypothetical protein J5855_06740 [Mailhella sp.]|nr:hypothetical protein [Mailhella sp.]
MVIWLPWTTSCAWSAGCRGLVPEVFPAECMARVYFPDDCGLVICKLQLVQPNSGLNKDFRMPDVFENVLCVFLPGGLERGFILGAFYPGSVERPADFQTCGASSSATAR